MNILLVNRVNEVWFSEATAIANKCFAEGKSAQNQNKDGDLFQASSGFGSYLAENFVRKGLF